MFRIRGKTENGQSVTGESRAESLGDAAIEAEDAADKAGDTLIHLSIRPLGAGKGLKVAEPRKRDASEKPAKKKK